MDTSNNTSPLPPLTPRRLLASLAVALVVAAVILVMLVLPAEYGIDPTRMGSLLGLTHMATPVRTITLTDNIGGNEKVTTIAIPAAGQPTPLPNPAVFQDEATAPQTRTLQVVLPPEKETEIKVKMQAGKVVLFSWNAGSDKVYVDYHGHDPAIGGEFFVRYKEEQESAGGNGSLTAPFNGEHGWYWLNFNDHPVTVSLTVTGYFDDVIDYGIH